MMIVYIDQSGKIEDTSKITIIAYAGDETRSVQIGALEKQKLIIALRAIDTPTKTYIYKIFSGLIYLLIKNRPITKIIIDREYPGHEATIKNLLLGLIDNDKVDVEFAEIGKQNLAHKIALSTFQKKIKPDFRVSAGDVFRLFYRPIKKVGDPGLARITSS